jgi:hypothetical protein
VIEAAQDEAAAVESVRPRNPRTDYILLASLATAGSLIAFLHYQRTGAILLYGDAVAHINIARRVFDSRTPGPLQLGTVWLPLPHLLILPFIAARSWWQSGVGGSIPSMIAYVATVLGIFRLVFSGLAGRARPNAARFAAWFAAAIVAANPNLLYLQSTAMTEPLQLALFVWATVYFSDYVRRGSTTGARSLLWCGVLVFAGTMTRYDGWFAAGAFGLAALVHERRSWVAPASRRRLLAFAALLVVGPTLWFGYNALVWGNPLEFATGPYSARGIEQRSTPPGSPHHPGWGSPRVAAIHFIESARLNLGEWRSGSRTWFPMAIVGSVALLLLARELWPWLLLWLPLPFYALSIAYGGVPIFVPPWWPFSYYNVRYGIELLPALAVFFAAAVYFVLEWRWPRNLQAVLVTAAIAIAAASYLTAWAEVPISLREAQVNSRSRIILEAALADRLLQLPPDGTLLMYTGEHGGALQRAGIPLRRTINESNYRLWQRALAEPAAGAEYVVAADNDPVASAVAAHPSGLQLIATLHTPGQPQVRIYRSLR